MKDYQRKHSHPDGTQITVGLFRGRYTVAANGHSIGSFGPSRELYPKGVHAFESGVRIGTYEQRLAWVEWASGLSPSDLPTNDIAIYS